MREVFPYMAEHKALYRKWRPRDFDDVCGQDSITDILKYEVEQDKLSHAYLFCGSRGTGKTSCAKILAKAVNCQNPKNGNPCNKCAACTSIDAGVATDVIEMDAASNNGVDAVRNMKDEIAFTPALLKYRVYIIDEVHMMSPSAFNALLKTLEEPPTYVIFILATTEFNKLPTTIVSRCQRHDFKRMSSAVIIDRLMHIASAEGIELTEDGARVIARVARGGMRDAVSLLELCGGTHRTVDAELVFDTVGSGNRDNAYKLIEALADSDFRTVYSVINDTFMKSADISVFWQEIIDAYRDVMVVKSTDGARDYLDLTELEYSALLKLSGRFSMAKLSYHASLLESAMADMQRAVNSKRSIAEIALTRMCDPKLSATPESLTLRVEELERELSLLKLGAPAHIEKTLTEAPAKKAEAPKPEPKVEPVSAIPKAEAPKIQNTTAVEYTRWQSVLERIGELKVSLSVQFIRSSVTREGNIFNIKMSDIFAKKFSSSVADVELVKGVIAEIEKINKSDIIINVSSQGAGGGSPADELDKLFG